MQIADALMRRFIHSGVAVVVEAKHLCMMMRGVEKQNSVMKTSCLLGTFKEDAAPARNSSRCSKIIAGRHVGAVVLRASRRHCS